MTLLPIAKPLRGRPAWVWFTTATWFLILGGCKEEHPIAAAPTPIRVQRIAVESAAEARGYTGVVRARYETDLGFRVAGKIVERLLNVGDRADKDQVLVRLDSTDYRLLLGSAEAELAAAKSSLAQAAADEQRYEKLLTRRAVALSELRGPWALRVIRSSTPICAPTRPASSRCCLLRWGR